MQKARSAGSSRWDKFVKRYTSYLESIDSTARGGKYQALEAIESLIELGARFPIYQTLVQDERSQVAFEAGLKNHAMGWSFGRGVRIPLKVEPDDESIGELLREVIEDADIDMCEDDLMPVVFRRLWPVSRAMRCATMFYGIPFTSKQHPWPTDDQGVPYAPLLQLNLGDISDAINLEQAGSPAPKGVGTGILQLWQPLKGDYLLRHLTPKDLNHALTAPPDYELCRNEAWQSSYELMQDESVLFYRINPEYLGVMFGQESSFGTDDEQDEMLVGVLGAAIDKIMEREVSGCQTMLFGVPSVPEGSYINDWAAQGWRCLMQIGDDSGFWLGRHGCGVGQIFFRKVASSFEYKFYWCS